MTFTFKVSYQDSCAYSVHGSADSQEVEQYRTDERMLAYMRSTFNHRGTVPNGRGSFESEIIGRQGGVANRTSSWRMTAELYRAFVQFLTDRRTLTWEQIKLRHVKWGTVPDELEPLEIPLPIYYDNTSHHWKAEPWFTAAKSTAKEDQ